MDNRVKGALDSLAVAPNARATERDAMVQRLDLKPEHTVVEYCAWDGNLTSALKATGAKVISLEPDSQFAHQFGHKHVSHDSWGVKDADRVSVMVALHHRDYNNKKAILTQAYQTLKPGGRVVIAEVASETAPAKFLDGPINKLSKHQGMYPSARELKQLLDEVGFSGFSYSLVNCEWTFESRKQAIDYLRGMFVIKAGDDKINAGITESFGTAVSLPWPLLFVTGHKNEQ